MHIPTTAIVTLLIAAVTAYPRAQDSIPTAVVTGRQQQQQQQAIVTPVPCAPISPPPSEMQTKKRFVAFGRAFLVEKNLTRAFEFIDAVYINNNPFAGDGPNAALDFLGPVWPSANLTVIRLAFRGEFGWLNYNNSQFGEIVDRFRWLDGCIREHWDVGESFPEDVPSFTI